MAAYFERDLEAFRGGNGRTLLSISVGYSSEAPPLPGNRVTVDFPRGPSLLLAVDAEKQGRVDFSVEVFTSGRPLDENQELLYSFLINYSISLLLQKLQADGQAEICLVHAGGAVLGGKGYLFTGPSGCGKTTVSRAVARMKGARSLGDDLVILSLEEQGWMLHGSPMTGELPRTDIANISVPLEAVFFLSHAEETRCQQLRPAEAAAALLGSLVPSYSLDKSHAPHLSAYGSQPLGALMDEAVQLAAQVPCFRLELTLAEQSWEEILDITSKTTRGSGSESR